MRRFAAATYQANAAAHKPKAPPAFCAEKRLVRIRCKTLGGQVRSVARWPDQPEDHLKALAHLEVSRDTDVTELGECEHKESEVDWHVADCQLFVRPAPI